MNKCIITKRDAGNYRVRIYDVAGNNIGDYDSLTVTKAFSLIHRHTTFKRDEIIAAMREAIEHDRARLPMGVK